jgi:hypothetical protein
MTRRRALLAIQLPFASGAARGARLSALGVLLALLGGCGSSSPGSNPSEPAAAGGAQSPTGSAGAGAAVEGSGAGAPGGSGPSNGASGSSGAAAAGSSGALSSGGAGAAGGSAGTPGGSAGTAGSSAAGAGGGQSGGPPSCAASKYLICEDFESTASGAIPMGWNKQGDIEVTTDDAYQSAHSLKVFVTAGKTENYRSISMNPSALGTGHWGRVYYKVQAPVPAYFAHDTFVAFTGNGPDAAFKNENVRVVDTVHNADATHQFLYNVQPSGAEFGKGSPYPYTFQDGGWHCAEWHIDNPTQSYHFYYDGTEVTSIAIDNGAGKYQGSEIPAAFSQLTLGVAQYQSPPNGFTQQPMWFTAWFDDLALDTNRIGCN